jgi:hypothetical protein
MGEVLDGMASPLSLGRDFQPQPHGAIAGSPLES